MASSSASEYFELPKYFLFSQKGIYSGSEETRDFNYKVIPDCPKEGERLLKAYIWAGRSCMEKSGDVTERDFPLSEEGYSDMKEWLEKEYLKRETVKTSYMLRRERAETLRREYVSLEDFEDKNRGD